jgi:hypothetical protein
MSSTDTDPRIESGTVPPLAPAQQTAQQPWASTNSLTPLTPQGIESSGPIYTYGLLVSQGRVKGLVSDYRTGFVTLTQEAVYLQGQAVLPSSTRSWIIIPCILLSIVAVIIVYYILEFAARRPQSSRLSWDDVQEIVLEPVKGRVCIVYSEPDKPKPVFSLAFKPGPYYDNFVQAARYFAPEKVREGKIGPVTSPWVYVTILGILAVMVVVGFVASQN